MRILLLVLLSIVCFGILGGGGFLVVRNFAQTEMWFNAEKAQLTPSQLKQVEKAEQAREALFARLKARLIEAVDAQGPAGAITVCSKEAPQIAHAVSEEFGVAIGRTSFKTRNPNNTPPDWARPYIDDRVDRPVYLEDSGSGRVAALLPIFMQPECIMCHGPRDTLPEEVRKEIDTRYPEDQAVGFHLGELRGWFHVEVPPGG